MKKLYTYLLLGFVALPIAGFTGGMVTSEKANAATKSKKKGSSANFYGRLWVQYSSEKAEGGQNNTAIFDDEGMGRVGVKGKSMIGNGYAVNYKVEYAIDLGDGDAAGTAGGTTEDHAFALKQGWLGFLTPMGQFKFGSMESPYKYLAKHDILHDTLAQMRDTKGISQGSMSHSSYWRGSAFYELKSGNFRFAAIKGMTNHTSDANMGNNKNDYGIGLEYKDLGIKGLSLVYAMNHDHSANEENTKYTITYKTKLAGGQKVKVWYMHEDVELDTKLFTTSGNGELDWYGITYSSGPMKLMFSTSDGEKDNSTEETDAYNLGLQYKLSKTSRLYAGYSDYEGDGFTDYRTYIVGLRHDF